MRENLFRGKRKDNGEWAYGFLVECNSKTYIYFEKIDEFCQTGSYLFSVEVIPETVGQYVGFSTGRAERIFEGDVIMPFVHALNNWNIHYVVIKDIRYCKELALYVDSYIKVGNIHDNPELLKDTDGGHAM